LTETLSMEQDTSQFEAINSGVSSTNNLNTGVGVNEERNLGRSTSSEAFGDQLLNMVRSLKEVVKLQKLAMEAQIDAREKRREAGFKRRDVWTRDATFMKELQRLIAKDQLQGFNELAKLAGECQVARNELGPLEEQGTQAEQRLEGEIWKLQIAEERMKDRFHDELQAVEDASAQSDSDSSEKSSISESEDEDEGLQPTGSDQKAAYISTVSSSADPLLTSINHELSQEILLFGIEDHAFEAEIAGNDTSFWDSDSGFGDIDQSLDNWTKNDVIGPHLPLPFFYSRSIYRYPELTTDFTTRREQINKWLLETLLLSHHEVNILMDQLKNEINPVPSNWSQLVIAYWELDGMATSTKRQSLMARPDSRTNSGHTSGNKEARASNNPNGKDIRLEYDYPTFNNGDHSQSLKPLRAAPEPPHRKSLSYVNMSSQDPSKTHEPS